MSSMAAQSAAGAKEASGAQTQKSVSDYPDEPFVYEFVHSTMRYENDGTGSRLVRARMRVNNAAGLARAGQLIFDYSAANEKLEIRSVKVIRADGSTVTAGPEAVQDLSSPVARQAPMYTDARQKHVTVPGLEVGDRVEYEVATASQPLMAGQFWQTWHFINDAICLDEQVDLDVPRSRALKMKSPSGVEPVIREDGDRRIYHWATSTLHRPEAADFLKNFQFDIPTLLQGPRPLAPRVIVFSTFQSWEEVGRWYGDLEHERRAPTPEVRAQAASIVQGKTTDLERVQALYEWVARNIRYVSLSFGVGRYQPHAAAEVLSNRYGDCKDKATLLEALLESQGLEGHAALIQSRMDLDPEVPTPLQFDHAINLVTVDGRDVWLDSTLGVGPFGYLLPQLRGKDALVVWTRSSPGLRKTPAALPTPTSYHVELNGMIDEDSNLDGKLSMETRGDLEVFLRVAFANVPQSQLSAIMQSAMSQSKAKLSPGFSVTDFKAGNPLEIDKPFRVEVHVRTKVEGLHGQKGDTLRSMTRSLLPASLLDDASGLLPQTGKLDGPKEFSLNVSLDLKGVTHGAWKPEHFRVAKDFAEYESDMGWDKSGPLHASWRLNLLAPEIPESREKEYADFRKQVVEAVAGEPKTGPSTILATRIPPGALPLKPTPKPLPPEASSLYMQAKDEMKRLNWGNAAKDLESVVKLAPDYDYGWSDLGRSYMALRKYPEAEAAFRKVVELAPALSGPYSALAMALTAQQKYAETVEVLEKHLVNEPDDTDALRRLGFAYLRMHRPESALPSLEKATRLSPKNDWGQFLLGMASLQTHRNEQAVIAFMAAIAVNNGDLVLNDVAYELAQAKTRLDLADQWSTRAVKEVETELNQVSLQTPPANTAALLRKIASYWDTLGWIKFQESDLPGAEKYIRAGWELADDTTIGVHLARIQEAQGRKAEAIEVYAQTLATVSAGRETTDDEKEARRRLAALLGGDALVDARVTESRPRAKDRRSVQVNNAAGLEGLGEYLVLVGPGGTPAELQTASPENQLENMEGAIRAAAMPQSFPDSTLLKMPRVGILACARSDQPCKFTLRSAGASERSFASAAGPASSQ